ncbi:hypothetical protein TRSC58_00990 [Trypanosoma rangeli SC58]|uniref:Uncharacterized protein n=1 Tax=Trypanosoma rangeli SC58 TaxID=429131 RepID=A0A061J8M8_TRYRA|nr:hypothetical protein TRSC58_00990 [Trypanosoma rangeli SC58]
MPRSKGRRTNSRARQERGDPLNSSADIHLSNEAATSGDSVVEARVRVGAAPERQARKTRSKKGEAASRYNWPCRILGALCALLIAFLHLHFNMHADYDFPCRCGAAGGGPLVSALAGRRLGLTGVHLHSVNRSAVREQLAALSGCATVYRLTDAFEDVPSLSRRLRKDAAGARCVVWLVEDVSVVRGVANALKELLEDNTLRGDHILREGSRGLFVLVLGTSREKLVHILPHRVVHMFHTITV